MSSHRSSQQLLLCRFSKALQVTSKNLAVAAFSVILHWHNSIQQAQTGLQCGTGVQTARHWNRSGGVGKQEEDCNYKAPVHGETFRGTRSLLEALIH
jgi:hypothetical protein